MAGLGAWLALTASASAAPQQILYVGDSLGVGTTPGFAQALGSTARVVGDSSVGRPSTEGLAVLEQRVSAADGVVVFDLGTNDDPANPAVLASDLAQARRASGRACMVVATLNRPPLNGYTVDGLNAAVERFARSASNVQLADWHAYALSDPSVLGPDHVHPTPEGYGIRAQLMAQTAAECGSAPAAPAVAKPQRVRPPRRHRVRPAPVKVPGIASSGIRFSEPVRIGKLPAQLLLPSTKPPYPAVVLVGESDAAAELAASRGIAALSYRGPGRAADARAALALLRGRKDIRKGALALWARGGAAPVVAAAGGAAAVVLVAPTVLPAAELRDWAVRRALGGPAPAVTAWLRLRARSDPSLRADPARAWRTVSAPVLALWVARDRSTPARASAVALEQALSAGRNRDRTFATERSGSATTAAATRWLAAHLTARPVAVTDTPLPPADGPAPARVTDASVLYSVPLQLAWLVLGAALVIAATLRSRERLALVTALVALDALGAIAGGVALALHDDGRGVARLAGLAWPFALAFALTAVAAVLVAALARRGARLAAGAAVWIALALFWLL